MPFHSALPEQSNYNPNTKLFNRLLTDGVIPEPSRALQDALGKLHKLVDQRVLTVHAMQFYFPAEKHLPVWPMPDVVLIRPNAPLVPFLDFVGGDLVLENRLLKAVTRHVSPNLRTLMAFSPSIRR